MEGCPHHSNHNLVLGNLRVFFSPYKKLLSKACPARYELPTSGKFRQTSKVHFALDMEVGILRQVCSDVALSICRRHFGRDLLASRRGVLTMLSLWVEGTHRGVTQTQGGWPAGALL